MTVLKDIINWVIKLNPYISPALLVVCIITIFSLYNDNQTLEARVASNTERVSTATKVLKNYTDDNGSNHIQVSQNILTPSQREELLKDYKYINDTLARALNIASVKINEYSRINATLSASNLKGEGEKGDSGKTIYRYKDEYANMTFDPIDTTFGLNYNLQLVTASFNKRSGFLNLKRTPALDISSPDKRITINGVEHFKVDIPANKFGAKLQARTIYSFNNGIIYPASTAELRLGSFYVEGGYYYDVTAGKLRPVVGVKLDLLKF